jgi:hypothetical protein
VNERVEKLVEKYRTIFEEETGGKVSNFTLGWLRAALLEAGREALKEAIEVCKKVGISEAEYRDKRPFLSMREKLDSIEREVEAGRIETELERLAGEETK